ncbi:MAG TPA: hypothetical protein VG291_11155 [Xanthobacteraceae bacterium]|nr:hypothetical protein [Xanthobacteraceae bacterium]
MADHGLDGIAPAELAPDGGREATLLSADEGARAISIMAAVSATHKGALDGDTGDPLGLRRERMAVIGVSRQSAGADDELPTRARRVDSQP